MNLLFYTIIGHLIQLSYKHYRLLAIQYWVGKPPLNLDARGTDREHMPATLEPLWNTPSGLLPGCNTVEIYTCPASVSQHPVHNVGWYRTKRNWVGWSWPSRFRPVFNVVDLKRRRRFGAVPACGTYFLEDMRLFDIHGKHQAFPLRRQQTGSGRRVQSTVCPTTEIDWANIGREESIEQINRLVFKVAVGCNAIRRLAIKSDDVGL